MVVAPQRHRLRLAVVATHRRVPAKKLKKLVEAKKLAGSSKKITAAKTPVVDGSKSTSQFQQKRRVVPAKITRRQQGRVLFQHQWALVPAPRNVVVAIPRSQPKN